MNIGDLRGKQVAIKCVTKEEMINVIDFLHEFVPWAYDMELLKISNYDNGAIFLCVTQNGGYANFKGSDIINWNLKILAKDFLNYIKIK